MTSGLERNLRLFPYHEAFSASMIYLPIFVLFTRDNFGVSGALQIASLTYFFIVILEVPSGWMSDWLGRVPTLSAAAASFAIGQVCFLFGGTTFSVIVIGQFFVSAGYAFISGTDVSFHFDTLEMLGRGDEYQHRQARIAALSYTMRAGTAMAGGLLGFIDLRIPFAVALGFALAQLAVTRMFTEPSNGVRADPFVRQVGKCFAYLRNQFMAWIFFYGIALVVLEHVAFTLMQPWLSEALDKPPDELGATPVLSGALFAVVAIVGAIAARASAPAADRFGTVATLIGLGALSATIVTGMAFSYSLVVLALVLLRSVQGAAAPVLISAAVAPRTDQQHRATLLSLNSLAGRLAYGSMLWLLAADAQDDPRPFWQVSSVISWILVGLLLVSGAWLARRD